MIHQQKTTATDKGVNNKSAECGRGGEKGEECRREESVDLDD